MKKSFSYFEHVLPIEIIQVIIVTLTVMHFFHKVFVMVGKSFLSGYIFHKSIPLKFKK